MAAGNSMRASDKTAGAPSLLGDDAAAKPEELKILSALEGAPRAPGRSASRPWLLGAAAVVLAGAWIVIWQQANRSSSSADATPALPEPVMARAAAPAEAPKASTPVAAAAAAASAAVIETVAELSPSVSHAPAQANAASSAADTASAASRVVAAAAARHAGAKQPAAHAAPHKHLASAKTEHKPAARHEPATPAEDPDVDLLEAMVAHVRGKAAADTQAETKKR